MTGTLERGARRGARGAFRAVLTVLIVLAVCPYFVDLGGSSIWDANEAFYVETPREMIERGDYVFPTFNYEPRTNKPVLSYWIVAACYRLFGVSVAAQRIPIAFGAMVLIASAFVLALVAAPRGADARPAGLDAGLWAALGLAITPRLLMFARRIFIDVYISAFMALTLMFFALAERYPDRRRLCLALMYVSVGLGMLTKGPMAALLPGLVFLLYLVVHGDLRRARAMMIPAGVVIVSAIVVPWYAALYARDGWIHITSFILGENVARFAAGYGVESSRGPLWYLPVVFSDSFPWSAFLFASGGAWLADRRLRLDGIDVRVRSLLWLWILTIVIFFSLSAAKQDLYIFPIVPAVAALGGVTIVRELRRADGSRALAITAMAVGGVVFVVGAGVLYLFQSTQKVYALGGADLMGWFGIAGGAAIVALAAARRHALALAAIAATFVAINWVFVLRVLPSFEVYKPVPAFARTLAPRLADGDVVATYEEALPSLVYYIRRHVDMLFRPTELIALMRSDRTVYVALSAENYAEIAPHFGVETCVLERRPTFDVKLRNVLAREPLPELVLVTNRCR
jgi:4-amino-4-deoxy-L-arabinose transferase-like glycosyltransferase